MSLLGRPQFDQTCKAFIFKYSVKSSAINGLRGWSWNEHPHFSSLGYMSRVSQLFIHRNNQPDGTVDHYVQESDDEATAHVRPVLSLTFRQYVVFSVSFQVPVFYFSVNDSNGSPLTLHELVKTTIFRAQVLEGTEATTFALTFPGATFPLLSQGEHPTLGTPCWYFHPCGTSSAINEIMSEVDAICLSEEERLVRWLEAWFMIVGTIVNLPE